jgi:hypothetical protein
MSDIQSILQQNGINFPANSVATFGTAVQDFNNQSTLSQQVSSASSGFSPTLSLPSTNGVKPVIPQPGTPGEWQSIKYASDLINYAPKYRFIFKVKFTFNAPYAGAFDREFMYVVKEVDKPKVSFEYEDVNMYNFKTKVLKSIKHEPLNISFHDDIQNKVSDFFNAYRNAYSPVSNLTSDQYKTMEAAGMTFSAPGSTGLYSASMGLLAGSNVNILNHIDVVQVYAHGTRQTTYTFTNPRIESFDFDNLSHESSEGNGMTCQFSYDSLYISDSVVSGTPEYTWGTTDIIGGNEAAGVSSQIGTSMSAALSNSKSTSYTFTGTDASGNSLGNVANTFPSLSTDNVVSSAGAGSGLDFANITTSSATSSINQSTAGLNNTFGFGVSDNSAASAGAGLIDNTPDASDILIV